ncbi:MAG TPA: transglutaminase family protein [Salinarimonas sp.]|nr:transglutaminase family protein [Salinarimonas sp.]
MIYDIRHVTTYRYASPVGSARCTLRLAPVEGDGQRVIEHGLAIQPAPSGMVRRAGFGGGGAAFVTIEAPHAELRIEARSRVAVSRAAPPADAAAPPWETVRDAAFASTSLGPRSPAQYLFASRRVALDPAISAYAARSFPAERSSLEGALDLMRRIRADFAFAPGATDVATPPAEAFRRRRGVCQDFAHVMIAGLRGLGLPAAYVSGYLRTVPPPGRPRLQGADATHAWVLAWCGEAPGWVGLDPTNGVIVENDHVELARGRDYADVSPIDGVIVGGGAQAVRVAVDVIPLEDVSR